jgi:NADH dehydrogenase
LKPFRFKNLGQLAAIGHHTAVAEVCGFQFSGLLAWWFWRTVYLFKLPGIQRKLGVVFDWTLELFFKRNISVVAPQTSESFPEVHLEKGDVLFHASEPALFFYIVKSGRIELRRDDLVVMSLGNGEHFGEWALLHDQSWLFTAAASEPTALVIINRKAFQTMTDSSPAFRSLLTQTSHRFVDSGIRHVETPQKQ